MTLTITQNIAVSMDFTCISAFPDGQFGRLAVRPVRCANCSGLKNCSICSGDVDCSY